DGVMFKLGDSETMVSLKSLQGYTLLRTVDIENVEDSADLAIAEVDLSLFFDEENIEFKSSDSITFTPIFDKCVVEERTFWGDMQEGFEHSDYVWECVEMDRIDDQLGYKKLIIPS